MYRFDSSISFTAGHVLAQLVEALHYNPEGRGFHFRWCTGIFHWHNPSGRTMALGLTQSLTEMSTRNISWRVKAAGAYGWQPYHLQVSIVLKSGSLNLLEPSGPVQACNGIALPYFLYSTCRGYRKRISSFCCSVANVTPQYVWFVWCHGLLSWVRCGLLPFVLHQI